MLIKVFNMMYWIAFPTLSHTPTNKYIKARFNLNAFLFIKIWDRNGHT